MEEYMDFATTADNTWLIPVNSEKPSKQLQNSKDLQKNFYNISYPAKEKKYNTIELFAGAGGLALGVENAGFNTLGLIEFERTKEILLENLPKPPAVIYDIGGA